MLSIEIVRHVAKLAKIALSDDEIEKFSGQLSSILDYVEVLKEVDTDNVAITSQVTGLSNVMGEDIVCEKAVSREELLNCTELGVDSNQILVPNIMKN